MQFHNQINRRHVVRVPLWRDNLRSLYANIPIEFGRYVYEKGVCLDIVAYQRSRPLLADPG